MSISVNNLIVFRDDADAGRGDAGHVLQDRGRADRQRVVGSITADITNTNNAAGESALGDVIADAQLATRRPLAPSSRS